MLSDLQPGSGVKLKWPVLLSLLLHGFYLDVLRPLGGPALHTKAQQNIVPVTMSDRSNSTRITMAMEKKCQKPVAEATVAALLAAVRKCCHNWHPLVDSADEETDVDDSDDVEDHKIAMSSLLPWAT